MGNFNWKESHKAKRDTLFSEPPSLTKLIDILKSAERKFTLEERALISLCIATGGRASEVTSLKQKNIIALDYKDQEIPYDKLYLHEVAQLIVVMLNLKNKKQKSKRIPIIKSMMMLPVVETIVDRLKAMKHNPEGLIYTKGRKNAYWVVKKMYGNDMFPHAFRHAFISEMAMKGTPPQTIKQLVGWRSLENWNTYAHLSTKHLQEELVKAFGPNMEKYNSDNRPLTLNQGIAAYAAANSIGTMPIKTAKNQTAKAQIIYNGEGTATTTRIPDQARYLAAKIQKENSAVQELRKEKIAEYWEHRRIENAKKGISGPQKLTKSEDELVVVV